MFYRLFDLYIKDYLHTGYNCTSKEDVKKELIELNEPDVEEVFETTDPNELNLDTLCEIFYLKLEESETEFEEKTY